MDQKKVQLQLLAKRLNLSSHDEGGHGDEEFILTNAQVEKVKADAIESAKQHFMWVRVNEFHQPIGSVELAIAQKNWEEEIDIDEVLRIANIMEHRRIDQVKFAEERASWKIKKRKELHERCNARYMFNLMAHTSYYKYGRKLVVDDTHTPLIKALCFFLSRDERFETELGYDLNKGLWIEGQCDLGKTYKVMCVAENEYNPITCLSMIDITDELKETGRYDFDPSDKTIYIDDVGTEEPLVKYYGTNIRWFKEFIEKWYQKNLPNNKLIITTNYNFNQVEEAYGFRVRSRVKQMFNIISVSGVGMRGLPPKK